MLRSTKILCALVMTLLPSGTIYAIDDTAAKQLEVYETACRSLSTYDVELHLITTIPPESKGYEQAVRQWTSEGRFRSDQLKDRGKAFTARQKSWIWDGSQEAVFSSDNKQALLNVRPVGGERTSIVFWSALFREFFPNRSYASLMRERENLISSHMNGSVVLFAPPTARTDVDYGNIGFRLTLDPDQGFMPIRVEQLLSRDKELRVWTRYVNDLKDVGDGVWVPVRSQRTVYDVSAPNESVVVARTELRLALDRSTFNVPIESDVFEIGTFPDGTTVGDVVNKTISVVGRKDTAENKARPIKKVRTTTEK